jgi:uncharacterized protein
MKVSVTAAAVAAALAFAAQSGAASAQDFSCTGSLNAAERTICSSSSLKDLDERMARIYGWVWSVTPRGGREALREDQRAFLLSRNDCETSARCIRRAYRQRIGELNTLLATAPRRTRYE